MVVCAGAWRTNASNFCSNSAATKITRHRNRVRDLERRPQWQPRPRETAAYRISHQSQSGAQPTRRHPIAHRADRSLVTAAAHLDRRSRPTKSVRLHRPQAVTQVPLLANTGCSEGAAVEDV